MKFLKDLSLGQIHHITYWIIGVTIMIHLTFILIHLKSINNNIKQFIRYQIAVDKYKLLKEG